MDIKYNIFKIRYLIYTAFKKRFKQQPEKYLLILTGRQFPGNIRSVMKPLLASSSDFKYSIAPHAITILFSSYKKMVDINDQLSAGFEGVCDSIILLKANKWSHKFHIVNMSASTFRNIYYNHPELEKLNTFEKLESLQKTIELFLIQRERMNKFYNELAKEVEDTLKENGHDPNEDDLTNDLSKIDNDDEVNRILVKIKKTGIESLTEIEKNLLANYGRKSD